MCREGFPRGGNRISVFAAAIATALCFAGFVGFGFYAAVDDNIGARFLSFVFMVLALASAIWCTLYGWSTPVIEDFKPGERVLDLRAVVRSAAIFVGIVATPIAARAANLSWGLTAAVTVAAVVAGVIVGGIVGRVIFPAPAGQAVVVRWGRPSLGVALKASLSGGALVAIGIAIAVVAPTGVATASILVVVGIVVAVGVGSAAALL